MSLDPKKTRRTLRRVFVFAVLLVVGSVGVGSYLLTNVSNRFGATMHVVADTTQRVTTISDLDKAIHELATPGSDIFDSHDPLRERARLASAMARYTTISAKQRTDSQVRVIDGYADEINALGEQTIARFGNGDMAGAMLARGQMNHVVARSQDTFNELTNTTLTAQWQSLTTKQRAVGVNRTVAWLLAGILIATILVLIRVARATAERLEHNATERERLLTTLDRNATELQAFNRKLAESNRDLTDFAYVASHDLQEPLRKIISFGDRLNSRCGSQLSDDGRDYLARMQNAAARMQTLIHDLLTFSRVTTQGEAFVTTDLNRVVRGVLSDLEVAIDGAKATVEVDELPNIDIDPGQFRQLAQNLIGNALKFRRPEVATFVQIQARVLSDEERRPYDVQYPDAGQWWRISVRDNGIGFEQKYADKIFTVFQRLHGRTEYEGSGVGLSVCRRIVERHRGEIRAISRPGAGATFEIVLPAIQISSLTSPELSASAAAPASVQESSSELLPV